MKEYLFNLGIALVICGFILMVVYFPFRGNPEKSSIEMQNKYNKYLENRKYGYLGLALFVVGIISTACSV